jgi:hypothetical protein
MVCWIAKSPKAAHFPPQVLLVKHERADCQVSALKKIARALADDVVERLMRVQAPGADNGFSR